MHCITRRKSVLTCVTKWSAVGRLSKVITKTMTIARMAISSTRAVPSDNSHLRVLFRVLSLRKLFAIEHSLFAILESGVSMGNNFVAGIAVRVSIHLGLVNSVGDLQRTTRI